MELGDLLWWRLNGNFLVFLRFWSSLPLGVTGIASVLSGPMRLDHSVAADGIMLYGEILLTFHWCRPCRLLARWALLVNMKGGSRSIFAPVTLNSHNTTWQATDVSHRLTSNQPSGVDLFSPSDMFVGWSRSAASGAGRWDETAALLLPAFCLRGQACVEAALTLQSLCHPCALCSYDHTHTVFKGCHISRMTGRLPTRQQPEGVSSSIRSGRENKCVQKQNNIIWHHSITLFALRAAAPWSWEAVWLHTPEPARPSGVCVDSYLWHVYLHAVN